MAIQYSLDGDLLVFFFSSRRRHTRFDCDWSSDVCSSDLGTPSLAEVATAAKLGVPREEIDDLCDAVLEAVAGGPLDPNGLKAKLGDAVRNLGDAGKKKGITTTLPVALGLLQASGRLRPIPLDVRLDQQRYSHAPRESPASKHTDEE